MVLKLVFLLRLILLLSVNILFSKGKSIPVPTAKHQSLIDDVIASDTVTEKDDNSLTRSSKITQDVFDCSSVSWNFSSNCTNLSQLYFDKNSIYAEKIKVDLLKDDPTLFGALFTQNVAINPTAFAQNIHSKMIKTGLNDKSHDMRSNNYTEMTETGLKKVFDRERREKVTERSRDGLIKRDSLKLVLRKIYPDNFHTNSDSNQNNQRIFDFTVSTSRKKFRVKAKPVGRFDGESFYFRDAPEDTTEETSSNPSEEASSATPGESSSITSEGTSSNPPEEASSLTSRDSSSITSEESSSAPSEKASSSTSGDSSSITSEGTSSNPSEENSSSSPEEASSTHSENASHKTHKTAHGSAHIVSKSPDVNYHYHFHYFGGVALPTFPTFETNAHDKTTKED